jgi:predicted secreted Zn-dependent protease
MTRKVFLILLALVLALSVGLVACTTAEQEEEEEEEEPGTWTERESCVIAMEEWVGGWADYEYLGIPNGVLTFPMEPCASFGLLATGQMPAVTPLQATTVRYYDVEGDDCPEVLVDIFHPDHGKGFKVGNETYAAYCGLSFAYNYSYDAQNGMLNIASLTWPISIMLPRWVDKAACGDQDDVNEWDRWIAAVEEHENGHRDIYNANSGMPAVRTAVVGQPTQVAAGLNETEQDLAIAAFIQGTQQWQDLWQAQINYDAPFDAQNNPTGTDHGATQNATLNCP